MKTAKPNHPSKRPADRLRKKVIDLEQTLADRTAELQTIQERLTEALVRQDQLSLALEEQTDLVNAKGLSGELLSDYQRMVRRFRAMVQRVVPQGSQVLVVSKGDPALLRLAGRSGRHFPNDGHGTYVGYHPACDLAATALLEAERYQGSSFLALPATAFWWMEHYRGFFDHLDRYYVQADREEDTGVIYELRCPKVETGPDWQLQLAELVEEFGGLHDFEPSLLNWGSGQTLDPAKVKAHIFSPPEEGPTLPYLDHTVDIVLTAAGSDRLIREARRVASQSVLTVRSQGSGEEGVWLNTVWKAPSSRRQPTVSMIIPCHNGSALTAACLESLVATLPDTVEVEVIVVDDAAQDDTASLLRQWARRDSRVKVIHNRRNMGFLVSCNTGARAARGEVLILANNDVVFLPGWLPPLLRTLRNAPQAGAVGAKLILPTGVLQEAGGIVFNDATALNIGRGDTDLDAPLYSYLREADYCSAALLATPREIFSDLRGFDRRYRPAYYEDTDYCFRLREGGLRVYYQPECAVVHVEGGTSGRDLSNGEKQYQAVNRAKFARRWRKVLRNHPQPLHRTDPVSIQWIVQGGGRPTGQEAKS